MFAIKIWWLDLITNMLSKHKYDIAISSGIIGTLINISNCYFVQLIAYLLWCIANSGLLIRFHRSGDKKLSFMYGIYLLISLLSVANRLVIIFGVQGM